MSYDLFLSHLDHGALADAPRAAVLDVLARYPYEGPDEFGFYVVTIDDQGYTIEFSARGLDGSSPFQTCAFHLRGSFGEKTIEFIYDIARAGRFIVFNPQGGGATALFPPSVTPDDLAGNFKDGERANVGSAGELHAHLTGSIANWQAFRDQVVSKLPGGDT
ncbi:MAG: hypothetical protein K0U74_06500 [Alphaproteobacteria bacterium]|nr:hypothetical protein [Alphaproteobacteria bacterium]